MYRNNETRFVPSSAAHFNGSEESASSMLDAHLVNMHVWALNTLTNPRNYGKKEILEEAKSRLVKTLDQIRGADISNVDKMVIATTKEDGMIGAGEWFAQVAANIPPDYAASIGRIALEVIINRKSPHAQDVGGALASFSSGFTKAIAKMDKPQALAAYKSMQMFTRINEHRYSSETDGESYKVYRNYIQDRLLETQWSFSDDLLSLKAIEEEAESWAQERIPVAKPTVHDEPRLSVCSYSLVG